MGVEEIYSKKLEQLFDRHPSVQQKGFAADSFKPGLERMQVFDSVLGHPWKKYRCIHVAGTNGKGSVCSMLAASLAASGCRVGLYTSPHILDFRERIRLVSHSDSGEPSSSMISREEVLAFIDSYQKEIEEMSLFEISTAMAFMWFAAMKVDYAVVEVGLGGRLDSTNIIIPEVSVITSIGLDHCAILGDSREKIASEKAGIFKPSVPAVVGFCDKETAPVFKAEASAVGAPLHFVRSAVKSLPENMDLAGPYQRKNLATVLKTLQILGRKPDMGAIARTASITAFAGRWDTINGNPAVIADIGHNPAALKINFARLKEMGRPLVIVYGIMADKDLDGILPLMPSSARYVLCQPATPRALPLEDLCRRCREGRPDLEFLPAPSVGEALSVAESLVSGIKDALIYVGGSTFVVSEAMKYYEN